MILTSTSLIGIASLFSSSAIMPVLYSLAQTKERSQFWLEFRFPTDQIVYMTESVLELVFWLVTIGLISIICLLPLSLGYLHYHYRMDMRKAVVNGIIGISGMLLTACIISIGVKGSLQIVSLLGFLVVGVELLVWGILIKTANDTIP